MGSFSFVNYIRYRDIEQSYLNTTCLLSNYTAYLKITQQRRRRGYYLYYDETFSVSYRIPDGRLINSSLNLQSHQKHFQRKVSKILVFFLKKLN